MEPRTNKGGLKLKTDLTGLKLKNIHHSIFGKFLCAQPTHEWINIVPFRTKKPKEPLHEKTSIPVTSKWESP